MNSLLFAAARPIPAAPEPTHDPMATPGRHPDCDTLEALLGPGWACSGHYVYTDGIGVAHIDSGDLFSVNIDPDGIGYIVLNVEGTIIPPASIPTLSAVATLLLATQV